ncbi:Apoptosis-inducing factor 1, mitochondrial [Terramyces sp. JEL0728]|nr:Apoptosis-inducing factor 1, mitochondrial [Terramyces sp. JEL0728]
MITRLARSPVIFRRFSSHKSDSNPSTFSYVLLLAAIGALGPGYFLLKPSVENTKPAAEKYEIPKEFIVKEKVDRIPGIPYVDYVLVGGGTASYHAMLAIREQDPEAQILIISEEDQAPYQRPPLSKELWTKGASSKELTFIDWQNKRASVYYTPKQSFTLIHPHENLNDKLSPSQKVFFYNSTVSKLDPVRHTVTTPSGEIQYKKVLIATGGVPRKPDFLQSVPENAKPKVSTFRTVEDFQKLEKISKKAKTIVVVGGGFLGSELAAALGTNASKGQKIIQLFPEVGNMGLLLPTYLTKWTSNKLQEIGVSIEPETAVKSFNYNQENSKVVVELQGKESLEADHVIVATGLQPNTAIAKNSGLEIDPKYGGILVNAELEARSDVFVAGDVCSYHDVVLGRRRVEHYDHAVMSGKTAGLNMTGQKKPYDYQSMFWSNIGPKVAFEAVGILDKELPTVSVWSKDGGEQHGKGAVYYLRNSVVVGILLWNLHGKIDQAREILAKQDKVKDPNLLAKLTEINKKFPVLDESNPEFVRETDELISLLKECQAIRISGEERSKVLKLLHYCLSKQPVKELALLNDCIDLSIFHSIVTLPIKVLVIYAFKNITNEWKNTKFHTLRINESKINKNLFVGLKDNKELKALSLYDDSLEDNDAFEIAKFLADSSLNELDLSLNTFGKVGFKVIVEQLRKSRLEVFNISYNPIGSGLQFLVDSNLKKLVLDGVDMDIDGVAPFANNLRTNMKLTYLSLENSTYTLQAFTCLFEALAYNICIYTLNMMDVKVEEDFIEILTSMIRRNRGIRFLKSDVDELEYDGNLYLTHIDSGNSDSDSGSDDDEEGLEELLFRNKEAQHNGYLEIVKHKHLIDLLDLPGELQYMIFTVLCLDYKIPYSYIQGLYQSFEGGRDSVMTFIFALVRE